MSYHNQGSKGPAIILAAIFLSCLFLLILAVNSGPFWYTLKTMVKT